MLEPNLHEQVARFFAERLNLSVPSEDEDLFETGALDSLTFVELVVYLEQQFDIRVSADELEPEHFRSIRSITGFVAARQGLKKAAVGD